RDHPPPADGPGDPRPPRLPGPARRDLGRAASGAGLLSAASAPEALATAPTGRRRRRGPGRAGILGLRVLSVAIILAAWEWYGRRTNPLLFTNPTAIARAGLELGRTGGLWR